MARHTGPTVSLAVSLLLLSAFSTLAQGAVAPPEDLQSRMLRTYVHGVTDQLAAEVVSESDLPELRRMLLEPSFPRRDNVVAFLAHRDGDAAVAPLLAFLEHPPARITTPEEDRALLLAPQALGQLARRGSGVALDALLAMTAAGSKGAVLERAAAWVPNAPAMLTDLQEQAVYALGLSGSAAGRARLQALATGAQPIGGSSTNDIGVKARQVLEGYQDIQKPLDASQSGAVTGRRQPVDAASEGGPAGVVLDAVAPSEAFVPETQDTQPTAHRIPLTYANHVQHTIPVLLARAKQILRAGTLKIGRQDYTDDVGCCIDMPLSGTQQTFGSNGDGLLDIDTNAELSAVLSNPISRVKVVRTINYCGGTGSNIIGCAGVGGFGMAVVRLGDVDDEGAVWAHEYGHNTGLGHNTGDSRAIMYPSIGISNVLNQGECNAYHFPPGGTQMTPTPIGACGDPDGDAVASGADNCNNVANVSQADQDSDGQGDACDPCPTLPACDSDGDGVFDDVDNCLGLSNPDQANQDGDQYGDACDSCIYDPFNDLDGDGLCIPNDNCPSISNSGQQNTDGDAQGDICDPCPLDAANDGDGDGRCANVDNCPSIANAGQEDWDGDGIGNVCDADAEGDGVIAANDNCPLERNASQSDRDGDNIGDLCDGIRTVGHTGPVQYATIQAAINAASSGDVVLVMPGTYVENLVMKSGVDVVGPGPALATVDGSNALNAPVVAIENLADPVRITGFTLRGAAVLGSNLGGGVRVLRSAAEVDGNVIESNGATMGGGIYLEGDPTFAQPFAPAITNNVIRGNTSTSDGAGIAVYYGTADTVIRHNTIVENHTENATGGVFLAISNGMLVADNIVASNTGDLGGPGAGVQLAGATNTSFAYNDLHGNPGGDFEPAGQSPIGQNGNVSVAPGFVSPGTGDHSLAPGSPLIDAGSPDVSPTHDLLGAPRPLEGNGGGPVLPDIGAYERVAADVDGDGVANASDNCPYVSNAGQADADGDGAGNACDKCPATAEGGQRDVDADGIGDACDNCPLVANPGQEDTNADGLGNACAGFDGDADGVGDANDCAPGDPSAYFLPAEATSIAVAGKVSSNVSWSLPPSGTGTTSDLVSGRITEMRADLGYARASCLGNDLPGTLYNDVRANPPSGEGYYYLVRGSNVCGRGTYGNSPRVPDPRDALDSPGTVPCP